MTTPTQIYPGQQFVSIEEFRVTMLRFAGEQHFTPHFLDGDTTRVIVRCRRGHKRGEGINTCRFHVYASYSRRQECIVVSKNANITHNCQHEPEVTRQAIYNNNRWLTTAIRDNVPLNHHTSTSQIKATVGLHTRVPIRCFNNGAIRKARSKILGDTKKEEMLSYRRVPAYIQALQHSNPRTYTNLEVNNNNQQFRRVFICPATSRITLQHCRKLVATDGTFMKGRFSQTLLFACGIDADNHVVALAWAVVDGETVENWEYFFGHLRVALPEFDTPEVTLISDRGKGLDSAADNNLRVQRAHCCQHLAANVQQKHGKACRDLFWKCVRQRTAEGFGTAFTRLREQKPAAAQYVSDFGNQLWVSHHMPARHYGFRTSNIVESLNSLFLEEREMPIVDMLDSIWHRIMDRRFERLQQATTLVTNMQHFPPSVLKTLAISQHHSARNNMVTRSDFTEGRVTEDREVEIRDVVTGARRMEHRERVVVLNFEERTGTCTCGRFQENGIPCGHAIAFMQRVNVNPFTYIPAILSVETLRSTYDDGDTRMRPVVKNGLAEDLNCGPPALKRRAGRPKKQRFRFGHLERRGQQCSDCRGRGHNAASCQNPIHIEDLLA